jgi:hypothetical protein
MSVVHIPLKLLARHRKFVSKSYVAVRLPHLIRGINLPDLDSRIMSFAHPEKCLRECWHISTRRRPEAGYCPWPGE